MGVGLALVAGAMWGVSDFFGGLKSRTLPLLSVLAVSQPAGLVVLAALAGVAGRHSLGGLGTLYAALAGAGGVVGISALYRGLAVGTMGIVAPISATGPIVPVVVGVARGERPTAVQTAGIVLALAGIVLASRERVEGRVARLAAGAALGAVAAVCFGSTLLALDAASARDPYWAAFALRLTATTLVLGLVLRRRPQLGPSRSDLPALALVGLADAGGTALFAIASTKGLVSLISVLASLYPVLIVLLARLVLDERLERVQKLGAGAALAGAALISAG